MSTPDLLLIDGDVVAFIAAASVQHNVQDAYGNVTSQGNLDEGKIAVDRMLAGFRQKFGCNDMSVYLSDPKDNWRFDVDADYKNNRASDGEVLLDKINMRPLLLLPLKDYLRDSYKARHRARLEADDAIAIAATDPFADDAGVNILIIGRDKDFKCIPGAHYQLSTPELGVYGVSLEEADRWHMMQTLAGDATDGFKGCPGIGLKRAAVILDEGFKFVPEAGVLTSGKNKGAKTIRWHKVPCDNVWEIVVSCFEKAGQSEYEALVSARLAHLLRYGEYNMETAEVNLWMPPHE